MRRFVAFLVFDVSGDPSIETTARQLAEIVGDAVFVQAHKAHKSLGCAVKTFGELAPVDLPARADPKDVTPFVVEGTGRKQ